MWQPSDPHRKRVQHYDNGEPHFLTFSCYWRLPLLSKARTRTWFVDALETARLKHGFHLWAWVIMPEHVHLLLWPPIVNIDPQSTRGRVRGILSSIKRPVAEQAIAFLEVNSPDYLKRLTVENENRTYRRFWQPGTGYDENIAECQSLHEVMRYIHDNPVRRGLAARATDWSWSSACDWEGLKTGALLADRTLPEKLEIPWQSRHT